jgi:hypothetical protein
VGDAHQLFHRVDDWRAGESKAFAVDEQELRTVAVGALLLSRRLRSRASTAAALSGIVRREHEVTGFLNTLR